MHHWQAHLNPVLVAERWDNLDMAELSTEKSSILQTRDEILKQKVATLTETQTVKKQSLKKPGLETKS